MQKKYIIELKINRILNILSKSCLAPDFSTPNYFKDFKISLNLSNSVCDIAKETNLLTIHALKCRECKEINMKYFVFYVKKGFYS